VLLVAINILFIVDIELTLCRNKGDQNGDSEWGFCEADELQRKGFSREET
jgi:hypothetical protein